MMRVLVAGAMAMGATMAGPALAMRQVQEAAPVAAPGKRAVRLPQSQSTWGRKGAGISMAQQKRASIKKRNVARNRKAGRK